MRATNSLVLCELVVIVNGFRPRRQPGHDDSQLTEYRIGKPRAHDCVVVVGYTAKLLVGWLGMRVCCVGRCGCVGCVGCWHGLGSCGHGLHWCFTLARLLPPAAPFNIRPSFWVAQTPEAGKLSNQRSSVYPGGRVSKGCAHCCAYPCGAHSLWELNHPAKPGNLPLLSLPA